MNRDEQIKYFAIMRYGNVGGREPQYMLAKEGVEWDDNSMKLNNVKVIKEEESIVTIDDDELLYDSKHYDTFEYCVNLMAYNAYDDKGNKIEGKIVKFIKKEYDNPR